MSRAAHKESVLIAGEHSDKLKAMLFAASEEADTLMDRIESAVGDDPVQTSARGAVVLTQTLREQLSVLIRTAATIKLHLNDYSDTF